MASDRAAEAVPLYDDLGGDYDRFVNWPQRLANELPFIESLFQANAVVKVLDAACGTGRHTIALAQKGYQATGADLSPKMIALARRNAREAGVEVTFHIAGLGELERVAPGPFDALICLGNSLPHLPDEASLRAALVGMAEVLRPRGILLLQNRNYDRVWAGKERFMPLSAHQEGDREWLFFRFMDFRAETLTFNMVTFQKSGGQWSYQVGSTELRPLFRQPLEILLWEAGFSRIETYGDYQGSPFDPKESGDLIIVAQRT